MEFVLTWAPLVLLLAFFLFIASRMSKKQMGTYNAHVTEVKAINDELIGLNREMAGINREMIAELREIKQILKDRN
jgi:ATP-dependent Zn protease